MLMFLRRLLTHNWLLKAFSLLLATLMWFAIWSGSNDQMTRTVQIGFTNIPDNMELTGETDIPVTLQLRGSFDLLAGLSIFDITPAISLAGQEPGPKSFPISENIDPPAGVEVFGVNPDRVQFDLERTLQKVVDIQPNIQGSAADRYTLAEISVTPERMPIAGPESRVAPIETLSTAPIRIDGRTESLSTSVNLEIPDTLIRLASFAPVDVLVEIAEIREQTDYSVEADPALTEVWEISVDTIDVVLSGPASEIETFTGAGVYFGFDADAIGEDGTVVPNVFGLPDSFEVLESSPDIIEVSPIEVLPIG